MMGVLLCNERGSI